MTIRTRLVEYTHEGTTLEGFLAWDDAITGKRPAVAVVHAWFMTRAEARIRVAAHAASECGLEHQFIEIDNPA